MNKEEIEYTIKTDRNTGEIVFLRGDYSFKQWGLRHEIIDLIEYLQQENKQLKEEIKKLQRIVISKQEDYLIISVGKITKVFKLNENKKWISEVGDSNE